MYDIIGDVHGFADELQQLLSLLSYTENNGLWSHPTRKAIFVGDLIDRGPKVRETLRLVKKMVDARSAFLVMGNHEYNAICYHTKHSITGEYLRLHTENNIKQHASTLNSFLGKSDELAYFINWFKTLPVFLEINEFRVIHATWIPLHIHELQKKTATPFQDQDFLEKTCDRKSNEFKIINDLLKGIEIYLPKDMCIISNGRLRDKLRIKWWINDYKSINDLIIGSKKDFPNVFRNFFFSSTLTPYHDHEKPLFIGHYGLSGIPSLLKSNIFCLDYDISKGGKLLAYRWNEEEELDISNVIYVEFDPNYKKL